MREADYSRGQRAFCSDSQPARILSLASCLCRRSLYLPKIGPLSYKELLRGPRLAQFPMHSCA